MSDREGWSHEEVETNGVRLHCVAQGEGDLVVLLHGFPESWYSWRHQIPVLAKRFLVVAPDMRGYNLSEKPEGVSSYDVSQLTADVRGLIEAFGAKKARVLGHDWGGAVAWMLAITQPDCIEKLAVLNCPHPIVFVNNLMMNPRQMLRSWYMFFFQIPGLPELAFRSGDYYPLKHAFRGWAVNKKTFSDEDIEELKKAASQPGALTAGMNYYRAMLRNRGLFEMRKDTPKISCPTLLIWAEEDRALGKELTYGMEPYFSDGLTIRYIPNCSHWVQQEQPLLVNEFLEEFL